MTRALQLRQEIPVPLVQGICSQPFRPRLVRQQQHPRIALRPSDAGGLGGGHQVHRPTRHRRHLLPLRLDQVRGSQMLLSGPRQGPPGLQLHLGQRQLLLVDLQLLHQLRLGQDPAIRSQHPEVVQLGGQGQSPTLARQVMGQILGSQPPGYLPDDLQLTGRQGHDAPQFPLQFLGRQDFHPSLPVQTPSLDDLAIQPLHGRPLDLSGCLGGHTPAQLHLQAVSPGRLQHGVCCFLPTAPRLGQHGHVPPVVPGAPSPIRRLRRSKGHRVGMEVNFPPAILRMEVREGERSGHVPFPLTSTHPNPDRLPIHFSEVGGHGRPQNLPSDLGMILQTLAQFSRQGDQRFLRLPEQPAPHGQLVSVQVVPHGQLTQQLGRRQLLFHRVPSHLLPEIRVDHLGLHLTVSAQVAGTNLQPSRFLRLLEVTPEVLDDPGR